MGIAHKGDAAGSGSSAVTSSAAAQIFPAFMVSVRAASSATLPRATFTNIEDGFMAAKAAALIRPVVSGVSAQVSATMSACGTSFTRSAMPWIESAPLVPCLGSRRILLRVELPLALPAIFAGLRVATVSTVALVTVGALINYGGLGNLIYDGLNNFFKAEVATAAALCVVVAVVFDVLLLGLQWLVTPWRRARRRAA